MSKKVPRLVMLYQEHDDGGMDVTFRIPHALMMPALEGKSLRYMTPLKALEEVLRFWKFAIQTVREMEGRNCGEEE